MGTPGTSASTGDEIEIEYAAKKSSKGGKEILYCCKITWFKGSGKMEKVDEEDSSKVQQHSDHLTFPHPTTTDSDDHCPSTPQQNGITYRPSNTTDYQTPVPFPNDLPPTTVKKKNTLRKKKRTNSLPPSSKEASNFFTPQRTSALNVALPVPTLEPADEKQAQNGELVPSNDAISQIHGISKHYSQQVKLQKALDNRHS